MRDIYTETTGENSLDCNQGGLSTEVPESHSQRQSWPRQAGEDSEQKEQPVLWPEMEKRLAILAWGQEI